ncbi:MAG: ABC transporter substrate-binding protein [Methylococcales bacterium]|jgi:phospholipid transport system substrate-binding protein|nr:ABC transporter substrate-binding protein [Methylococcales bacterium]MBT7444676.1 ABC transporter substrate-binding protein [Methylococcales bacterium]
MMAMCRFSMLSLMLCLPVLLQAGTLAEPAKVVKQVSDDVRHALTHQRAYLKTNRFAVHDLVNQVFVPNVDFYRIGSLMLGKYWKMASECQKNQFVKAFKAMLVRSYSEALVKLDGWEMVFERTRFFRNKTRALVRTFVSRPKGPKFEVYYRMHYKNQRWQVYDVVVEGISLVTIYQRVYTKRVKEQGFDVFLQGLGEQKAVSFSQ